MRHTAKQLARALVMLLFLCSGCVNLERDTPARHYFVIEIPHSANPGPSASDQVLLVSDLRISPRYADKSFVYRISDAGYESDYYNQFLTSPDIMITEELRRGLAMSPQFKFVVGPSNSLQSDYDLEGSINNLYGDFRDLNHPTAVLEIDFFLYKENGGNHAVVMQKRYMKSVPISERSPEALVKGWGQALQEIVMALAADLKTANL
jgi:cholesterol transport system auxiliary component